MVEKWNKMFTASTVITGFLANNQNFTGARSLYFICNVLSVWSSAASCCSTDNSVRVILTGIAHPIILIDKYAEKIWCHFVFKSHGGDLKLVLRWYHPESSTYQKPQET